MPEGDDNRIRVLQLVSRLGLGGLEALVARLVQAFDPTRFELSACVIEDVGCFGEQLRERGYTVHNLNKAAGIRPSIWFRLARILRRERIDIVHAHNFQALFWGIPAAKLAVIPACSRLRRAFIYTSHGGIATVEFRKTRRVARLEPILARFASCITGISQSARAELVEARVCKPDDVIVIPNGIDASRCEIELDRRAGLTELGLPPEGPVLGACSRIVAGKGIDRLIDAMPKVIEFFPNASALIAGDGPLLGEMRELAAERGVAERVFFAGYSDDVPRLMALMDIFVLASDAEGLSMALLEAMASGVPAVATAVGDNPVAIIDVESGRIIDLERVGTLPNVLIEVLSDSERLREMGRRARMRAVEHYSQQKMIENYQRLFTEITGKRRPSGRR